MKKRLTLHTHHCPTWLLVLLVVLFIFRIPSFFEPYSYVDEVIYLAIGTGIQQGMTLYTELFDHKTPLIYFLAALVNGDQFWFKVLYNAWMLGTVVIFYKFVEKLFPKYPRVTQISTIIFGILTTLRIFEGMVIESEGLMIGPIILGLYLVYDKTEKVNNLKYIFAGILFSIATHLKVPALFDIGALIFLLFISYRFKQFFVRVIWVLVGFMIPTIGFAVLFAMQGALRDYIQTALLFNFGYITAFRPDDAQQPFLVRNAPLLTRAALAGVGVIVLWFIRKKVSRPFLLASVWLITSLFAITLSERPYPHYLVQMLPPISVLLGILFASPKYEQTLSVIPLFIGFLVPVALNTWHYKSLDYYGRFLSFANGRITKEEYFDRYDNKVNRNYKIAQYIREHTTPQERIFSWGPDAPVLYALTKRLPPTKYLTSFHINDLPDKMVVTEALQKNLPKYIIITPEASEYPELATILKTKYLEITTIDGAVIYMIDKLNSDNNTPFW